MRTVLILTVVTLVAWCMSGCSDSETQQQSKTQTGTSETITIYVVNYPLQYFAERIGGEQVEVECPAPSDVDPAFWNPDAETIVDYQDADLILLNGAAYAKWTAKVSLPAAKVVDTSKGFADRYIVSGGAVTHSHGPGGEHAHTGTAFTTWIDFDQAATQAVAIRDALTARWPDRKDTWENGFKALEADLRELDAGMQQAVEGKRDLPLVASHPVYHYLARRYGVNISSVMWEPDGFPTEGQWQELSHLLEDHNAKCMVWEGDPLPASVERLAAMGIQSIVFDPCGNTPDVGDFLTVMRQNIENLKAAYR